MFLTQIKDEKRAPRCWSNWWCLTVMEAVPMYHVCSFHKRLQTQPIPFRFRNTWREKKDGDEAFHTGTPLIPFDGREKKKKQIYFLNYYVQVGEKNKKTKTKHNPCRCDTATNHQLHTEPITVLNTRPFSIQAFLKAFGAFGALKGSTVPSSALL